LGASLINFAYYHGRILPILQYKKWKKAFMHKGFVGPILLAKRQKKIWFKCVDNNSYNHRHRITL
jgi:hypothetical protein